MRRRPILEVATPAPVTLRGDARASRCKSDLGSTIRIIAPGAGVAISKMIDAKFVPIDRWPGDPTRSRKRAPFGITYARILVDLERELNHLGAKSIVIEAFVNADDIRNDGWPRSSARFFQPGIVLSFRTRDGSSISFPCDTYVRWESNLRAICLTMTALRAINRYGVTKRQEQYQGWKRLESPAHPRPKDSEWAYSYLAALNNCEPSALRGNRDALHIAYKQAAKKTHPDAGGNVEAFQTLQEAGSILGL